MGGRQTSLEIIFKMICNDDDLDRLFNPSGLFITSNEIHHKVHLLSYSSDFLYA